MSAISPDSGRHRQLQCTVRQQEGPSTPTSGSEEYLLGYAGRHSQQNGVRGQCVSGVPGCLQHSICKQQPSPRRRMHVVLRASATSEGVYHARQLTHLHVPSDNVSRIFHLVSRRRCCRCRHGHHRCPARCARLVLEPRVSSCSTTARFILAIRTTARPTT